MLNLAPAEASRICMDECRAMCCRGPLILRLAPDEVAGFYRAADRLEVTATITRTSDGGGNVLFLDHAGEACPMLDRTTFACRIYEERPKVCREFPRKPEPGCAISGWTDDEESPG
jgi:Fe-S-cluster containining protein